MTRLHHLSITSMTLFCAANVVLGQADRVKWIYEIPSNPPGSFVGTATDGTVYVTDNTTLYSLTPSGSLNWTLSGAGGGHPITFGADGTIYTSNNGQGIAAVNPNGTFRWQYFPPQSYRNICGPNVGPDGNVYAVQEQLLGVGHGMYSVDADGHLRWTNIGSPAIGQADLGHAEIVFGPDRLYTGVEGHRGGLPSSRCFDFDGNQIWFSGFGGLEIAATSFPKMMPDGRVAFRWGQIGVMAVEPDGTVDWISEHGNTGLLLGPAVGPDGVIYSGAWLGVQLWAVYPDGSTKWQRETDPDNNLNTLSVAPDNSVVVVTGTPVWVGGWVRGYDPANGDVLWHVEIPYEGGLPPYIYTAHAAFSPDSRTAYITVRYWDSNVTHSYLYAIDVSSTSEYALTVDNLVGGSDASLSIAGATPNTNQYIAYSLRGLGSTFIPQLNVTLDLRSPVLLTSGRADANGDFAATVRVPRAASGRTVWFQGAEMDRSTGVVTEIVQ